MINLAVDSGLLLVAQRLQLALNGCNMTIFVHKTTRMSFRFRIQRLMTLIIWRHFAHLCKQIITYLLAAKHTLLSENSFDVYFVTCPWSFGLQQAKLVVLLLLLLLLLLVKWFSLQLDAAAITVFQCERPPHDNAAEYFWSQTNSFTDSFLGTSRIYTVLEKREAKYCLISLVNE